MFPVPETVGSWVNEDFLTGARPDWVPSLARVAPVGFWSDLLNYLCSLTPAPDLAEPGAPGLFRALDLRAGFVFWSV